MKAQATIAVIALLICSSCASTQESTSTANFRDKNINRDITKWENDREERLQQQIEVINRETTLEPKPASNPSQNTGKP